MCYVQVLPDCLLVKNISMDCVAALLQPVIAIIIAAKEIANMPPIRPARPALLEIKL